MLMLSWVIAVRMHMGMSIETYVIAYTGVRYMHRNPKMLPTARVLAGDIQLPASICLVFSGLMIWRLI